MHRGIYSLARAELGAVTMFEDRNNLSDEMVYLAFSQGGFSVLKCDANEQRIFSSRDIFPSEKIDGFYGSYLPDAQRANRFDNLGESYSIRKQQREITLHCREARKRLVAPRGFDGFDRCIERLEL